jgi:hypothetical protein
MNDEYYQRLTKIQPVKWTNIGQRLRKIPRGVWENLLQTLYRVYQNHDARFEKWFHFLKWFDTTTISMSAKRCPWAAKNGLKNAVRVALRVDDRTEKIELVVNGSVNTSDNSIFAQLLVNAKKRTILVFDAGFSTLQIIADLVTRGMPFVSVKSARYRTEILQQLSLPADRQVAPNWQVQQDYRAYVGANRNTGRRIYRCLTYYNTNTQETRHLFTDFWTLTPTKIFALYHRPWRIEVMFRWLKSEVALDQIQAFTEAISPSLNSFHTPLTVERGIARSPMSKSFFNVHERSI